MLMIDWEDNGKKTILVIEDTSSPGSSNEGRTKGFSDRLDVREIEGSRKTSGCWLEQLEE